MSYRSTVHAVAASCPCLLRVSAGSVLPGAIGLALLLLAGCSEAESGAATEPAAVEASAATAQTKANTPAAPASTPATPATREAPPATEPAPDGGSRIPVEPSDTTPPPILVEPPQIDMGFLKPGESKTGSVQMRNTGDTPLRIFRVISSCRCTTPSVNLAGRLVQPGESVEVAATYEGGHSPTSFNQHLDVQIDGFDTPVRIPVGGEVAFAVHAEPSYFRANESDRGVVTVSSIDGRPFRVLAANGQPPQFVDGFDPASDAPKTSYKLGWSIAGVECEQMPWWWVVETDHPETPLLDIRIRHRCASALTDPHFRANVRNPWRVSDQRALAGVTLPGELARIDVRVERSRGGTPPEIVGLMPLTEELLNARIVDHHRDGAHNVYAIEFMPNPTIRGLYSGKLMLIASDNYESPLWVIGKVGEARTIEPPTIRSDAAK